MRKLGCFTVLIMLVLICGVLSYLVHQLWVLLTSTPIGLAGAILFGVLIYYRTEGSLKEYLSYSIGLIISIAASERFINNLNLDWGLIFKFAGLSLLWLIAMIVGGYLVYQWLFDERGKR